MFVCVLHVCNCTWVLPHVLLCVCMQASLLLCTHHSPGHFSSLIAPCAVSHVFSQWGWLSELCPIADGQDDSRSHSGRFKPESADWQKAVCVCLWPLLLLSAVTASCCVTCFFFLFLFFLSIFFFFLNGENHRDSFTWTWFLVNNTWLAQPFKWLFYPIRNFALITN